MHTKGITKADGIHVSIGDKCLAEMDAAYHWNPNLLNARGLKGCSEPQISDDEMKANAKRFSLCWNSHDKLLAACEKVVRGYQGAMSKKEREAFPRCAKELDMCKAAIAAATTPQAEKIDSKGSG